MRKQLELFEVEQFVTSTMLEQPSHEEIAIHTEDLDAAIDPAWSNVADEPEERKPCGTVGTYQPKGSAHGEYWYFRFSYREGKRMKHKHIPGGNAGSSVAQQRAEAVRQAIARGATIDEVLQLIKKNGS